MVVISHNHNSPWRYIMKRFFWALVASLSFMSMSCHAEAPEPVQQVVYSLVVVGELFSQAAEDQSIISSASYIDSIDYMMEYFSSVYPQLPSFCQADLSGVIQIMEKIGLLNDEQHCAYLNQSTLQVLMEVLANNPNSLAKLIEETSAFIVKYQSAIPYEPPKNFNESDIGKMRGLSYLLWQLVSNPLLLSNDDFVTNLYNAFVNTSDILNNYEQQLVLFNYDLVLSGLYTESKPFFPHQT